MPARFLNIASILAGALFVSSCTQYGTDWRTANTDDLFGSRQITDCSADTAPAPGKLLTIPAFFRPAIRARFERHYDALNKRLIRAEALRMLLYSDRSVGRLPSDSDGIVSKFLQQRIPVFINTSDTTDIGMAQTAIERINAALRVETTVVLEARRLTDDRSRGNHSGIHLYFGSIECTRRVIREQLDTDFDRVVRPGALNIENLNGITLRQELTLNNSRTGRIHRSVAVIHNLENPEYKQAVIEHELLHAIGIKGHAQKLFWSQLSSVGGSIAPHPEPTWFDHRIAQFLYSEVDHGESRLEVVRKLDRWWKPKDAWRTPLSHPCALSVTKKQNDGDDIKGEELLRQLFCKNQPAS